MKKEEPDSENAKKGYTLSTTDIMDQSAQTEQFVKLVNYRMPFGKYKGRLLIDLPEPYVVWFKKQGFPPGELGVMLGILYEIKLNGLEYLFKPFRQKK